MQTMAWSDSHGMVDLGRLNPNGARLCVIAGDIAPLRGLSDYAKFNQSQWMHCLFPRFCREHAGCEFVIVPGNHDFWGLRPDLARSWMPKNVHLLVNSGCTVAGLKFWGIPNVPIINRRWAFESASGRMRASCEAMPDDTDVVVAHTPPRVEGEYIDCSSWGEERSEHFGSPELTEAIKRVQPQFCFCGHIHTGDHSCVRIGRTACYNVSLLNEAYRQEFEPLVLEV